MFKPDVCSNSKYVQILLFPSARSECLFSFGSFRLTPPFTLFVIIVVAPASAAFKRWFHKGFHHFQEGRRSYCLYYYFYFSESIQTSQQITAAVFNAGHYSCAAFPALLWCDSAPNLLYSVNMQYPLISLSVLDILHSVP